MAADALIFAKTRIEESLYQKAIYKNDDEEED
jgi:hypothetical protein